MNRVLKKVTLLMILMIILLSLANNVKASDLLSKMEGQATKFIEAGKNSGINYSPVVEEFKGLGQILTMIGTGVMVAVVTYMGIKYLTSGPEAQAKLKVQLIGVVVAGVVIFGAYQVWSIVLRVASKL